MGSRDYSWKRDHASSSSSHTLLLSQQYNRGDGGHQVIVSSLSGTWDSMGAQVSFCTIRFEYPRLRAASIALSLLIVHQAYKQDGDVATEVYARARVPVTESVKDIAGGVKC